MGQTVDIAVDVARAAAGYLGFVAPPASFYVLLAGLVMVYLLLVEWVKRWFYRRHAPV